jgi:hypothetical protein
MKPLTRRVLIAVLTFSTGLTSAWLVRYFSTDRKARAVAMAPTDDARHADADDPSGKSLAFDGTVLKIAPPVPGSGGFAFYRLAKYRVERVCHGRYTKSEIVVDHLSLTGEELNSINVGDRVCAIAKASEKIFTRTNVEGIREESEDVGIFYTGGSMPSPVSSCGCQN